MSRYAFIVFAAAGIALAATPAAAQQSDGKVLFVKYCRTCHGVTGVPSKQNVAKYPKIKNFTDTNFFTNRSDDSLAVVTKKGTGKDMKGFADKMSDTEIAAVVEYLHTLAKHESKPRKD